MSAIIVGTKIGKFIILPNDLLGKKLIVQRDYEPHFGAVVQNIIKAGDTCIDCGANLGYHTIKMAQLAGPIGRVFAFEPLRIIYQQLSGNVFLNNLYNVRCFNAALGNVDEIVEMDAIDVSLKDINLGATKVGNGGEKVEMLKMDNFNFVNVKFIKIDVQGYELEVLKGAEKTVAASRPILFFETDEIYLKHFNCGSEILMNYIFGLNYIIIRLLAQPSWDHLAVPTEHKDLIPNIMKDFTKPFEILEGKAIKLNFDGKIHRDEIYGSFEIIK